MHGKKNIKAVIFFVLFSLSSCSLIKDHIIVIRGNNAFDLGAYQKANYYYLKVLKNQNYSDLISYNLGNVYHDLGAYEEALAQWEKAEDSKNQDLRFRIAFNRGVLYYGRGDYNAAFEEFRKAILIQPVIMKRSNLLAARTNLELCLEKIKMETVSASERRKMKGAVQPKVSKEDYDALMNYVQERERLNWDTPNILNTSTVEDY